MEQRACRKATYRTIDKSITQSEPTPDRVCRIHLQAHPEIQKVPTFIFLAAMVRERAIFMQSRVYRSDWLLK